jgi:hypothetical protein
VIWKTLDEEKRATRPKAEKTNSLEREKKQGLREKRCLTREPDPEEKVRGDSPISKWNART